MPQRGQLSLPILLPQLSKPQGIHDLPALSQSVDDSQQTFADKQSDAAKQPNSGEQPGSQTRIRTKPYQINVSWPKDVGPIITYAPKPEYPEGERKKGKNALEGVCDVALVVDENGIPQRVHVVNHLGIEFDRNAVKTVEQFRFTPAFSNGKPVSASLKIGVIFRKDSAVE
jgi:TonB family protein